MNSPLLAGHWPEAVVGVHTLRGWKLENGTERVHVPLAMYRASPCSTGRVHVPLPGATAEHVGARMLQERSELLGRALAGSPPGNPAAGSCYDSARWKQSAFPSGRWGPGGKQKPRAVLLSDLLPAGGEAR